MKYLFLMSLVLASCAPSSTNLYLCTLSANNLVYVSLKLREPSIDLALDDLSIVSKRLEQTGSIPKDLIKSCEIVK